MIRDITMIISVIVSFISVGFGVYEGVQSKNTRAFAYEQVYRVLNIVQEANVTPFQRAAIANAALSSLAEPPSVLDLSRSSADIGDVEQICTEVKKGTCTNLASELAGANKGCAKKDQTACVSAKELQGEIISQDCIACFVK